ncbi:uncharacterized protein LOC126995559 [Eriocheir sinensis]|uniref:uncharacterized protein LOC126995559 n=1 Tax=Eriocheir sinensis TaxID=95602 RepID=UPI0021C99ACA|nr:uncharacterized protein LOC126995559 [Eriocheir sinensis]
MKKDPCQRQACDIQECLQKVMSSSERPFNDGKTPGPAGAHPNAARPSFPPNNRYSLNLKPPSSTQTSSTYQVAQPRKIGRVKLWIYRNPLTFNILAITIGLGIFFSRPIYDIFIREPNPGPRPKERKFGYSL